MDGQLLLLTIDSCEQTQLLSFDYKAQCCLQSIGFLLCVHVYVIYFIYVIIASFKLRLIIVLYQC